MYASKYTVTNKYTALTALMLLLSSNEEKKKSTALKTCTDFLLFYLPFIPIVREIKLRVGFNPQFTCRTIFNFLVENKAY